MPLECGQDNLAGAFETCLDGDVEAIIKETLKDEPPLSQDEMGEVEGAVVAIDAED